MVEIRPVKNSTELDQAFSLSTSVFSNHNSSSDMRLKDLAWGIGASLKYEDVIVVINDLKVLGVCRICPCFMTYEQEIFKVAGLSSICILDSQREKGLGRNLMEYVIKLIDKRGYDFAYLIARRAVDHFYRKFGFFGASSYPRVRLLIPKELSPPVGLKIRNFELQNYDTYNLLYQNSYRFSFGASIREKEFWKKVETRLKLQPNLKFKEFVDGDMVVGYTVDLDKKVIEMGVRDKSIHKIIELYFWNQRDNVRFEMLLPHSHNSLNYIDQYDTEFYSRRCLYGGHMLRWSNLEFTKKMPISVGARSFSSKKFQPQFSIGYLDEV